MEANTIYEAVGNDTAEHSKAATKKTHNFLMSHLASQKLQMALVIMISFLRSCSGFFLTVIIGEFFMLQFHTGSSKGRLLSWLGIHLQTENEFFVLFTGLLITNFIVSYLQKYNMVKQGEMFVKSVREKLFSAQIKSTEQQFSARPYGSYLLRYSNDMKVIQAYLTKGILGGISDVIFVSIGVLLLFKINLAVGLLVTGLFLTAAVATTRLSVIQKKFIRSSRNRRSNLLAYVTRCFSRFSRIKRLGTEDQIIRRFEIRSRQLNNANIRNGKISSLVQSSVSFSYFFSIGLILWMIGSNRIVVSSPDGLVVILVIMMIRGAFRRLLGVPSVINKYKISMSKIDPALNQ